ncbi:SDR family oxidoreductase [Gracilibacillus suaedae]|uniref:SDR family oxidoreductase n=1 Tax=Gracilibacillus suaedae TaxID=2820273 RepID=UPI001ABE7370|nr:SDR family oxidoreductase [Gracilibacillus suaedae]
MNILIFDHSHYVTEYLIKHYCEDNINVYCIEWNEHKSENGFLHKYSTNDHQVLGEINIFDNNLDVIVTEGLFFDVIINNLELRRNVGLEDTDPEQWHQSMTRNLHLPFLLIQSVLDQIVQGGQFIHLSSTIAISGEGGDVSYASHKSALESLSKSLSREVDMRSNVISVSDEVIRNPQHITDLSKFIYQISKLKHLLLNGQVLIFDNGETLT